MMVALDYHVVYFRDIEKRGIELHRIKRMCGLTTCGHGAQHAAPLQRVVLQESLVGGGVVGGHAVCEE